MTYQDILYSKKEGVARVTLNRPDVLNAFRAQTLTEMYEAFRDAWHDGNPLALGTLEVGAPRLGGQLFETQVPKGHRIERETIRC